MSSSAPPNRQLTERIRSHSPAIAQPDDSIIDAYGGRNPAFQRIRNLREQFRPPTEIRRPIESHDTWKPQSIRLSRPENRIGDPD